MQTKLLLLSLTFLLIFSGCGKIEEETSAGTIEPSTDNYTPNANNQCATDQQNSQGCFANEPFFAENQIDLGYWALYKKSNNYKNYYDMYYKSYQFINDGSVKKRFESEGYFRIDGSLWGVNEAADTISTDSGESFKLTGRRYLGIDCYDVTHNSATFKMCAESAVDDSNKNSSGYFGSNVKFGNNNFANYTAEGSWTIQSVQVGLNSDGTTSNDGEWGVSADGKIITIDTVSYIVNKYPDNNCIDTYTLISNTKQDKATLCKL